MVDFEDFKLQRKIEGKVYDIYSRSLLRMGSRQVRALAFSTDCFLLNSVKNEKKGTGNGDKCMSHMMETFNLSCELVDQSKSNCNCNKAHCIFNSINIPASDNDFIAASGFSESLKFLHLEEEINLDTLYSRAVELCGSDYAKLAANYGQATNKRNLEYCFLTSYYWLLFRKGYKLPVKSKISLDKKDTSWALGAALDIEMGFTPELYIEN